LNRKNHLEKTAGDFSSTHGHNGCPLCGGKEHTDFFEARGLPVNICVLCSSPEEAMAVQTGDVKLSYCHHCGFIHNRIFDPAKVLFGPGYEASLFHSQLFRSFLKTLAMRLIERYGIRNKEVFEIGCGAGDFLRLLCSHGKNNGIGIDPTIKEEGIELVGKRSIRFIRDYFSEHYTDLPSDLICCRSVFEDVPDPKGFLQMLRKKIIRDNTILYFEVPNACYDLSKKSAWGIYYEQCNHFTQDRLEDLFVQCGFDVLEAGTCYQDGQYVYVEAAPDRSQNTIDRPLADISYELPPKLRDFSNRHWKNVEDWTARLITISSAGKRVVVWGSGGKGIGFLNTLETKDIIPYVIDINPNRQGKYIPGSGQKIQSPEFLIEYKPHSVFITNPLYEEEIKEQVREYGVRCDFYCI